MAIFEVLLFIFAIFAAIYLYLKWKYNYWRRRGVIGPKPSILFGNLRNIILQKKAVYADVDEIYKKYKGVDKFVGIYTLTNPELLIIDSNIVRDVLVTRFKNFSKNGAFVVDPKVDPILSKNPFLLSGAEWKQKRSESTPALTVSRVKASHPIMLEVCKNMTQYLENEVKIRPKDGINGKQLASKFTMEIVANCIFGFEAGAFKEGKCEIMEMGSNLLDLTMFDNIYLFAVRAFPIIRYVYIKQFIPKKVQDYFSGLMDYAIKLRKNSKNDRVDFLNYLLQLQEKKNLSAIDMAAHTMTFFIDGFETSSVLISNCLYLLAKNINVQNKLRQKIRTASTNTKEGENSFDVINDLQYLDQVINETFRLLPPGAILTKVCTESCELSNIKGQSIKIYEEESLMIPIYSIHRDEEYYAEPDKFIPERFDEENGGIRKYKDMGVFLPFSDGPRACLGQRFALAQSKAAIFEIIKNWSITLNEKTLQEFIPDPATIFVMPKGGIWLNFQRVL